MRCHLCHAQKRGSELLFNANHLLQLGNVHVLEAVDLHGEALFARETNSPGSEIATFLGSAECPRGCGFSRLVPTESKPALFRGVASGVAVVLAHETKEPLRAGAA